MLQIGFRVSIVALSLFTRPAFGEASSVLLPLVPIEFTVANEFDLRWDALGSRILKAGKEPSAADKRLFTTNTP